MYVTMKQTEKVLESICRDIDTDMSYLTLITPDIYDAAAYIIQHYFVTKEPLNEAFGVTWDKSFRDNLLRLLDENLSLGMVDKHTNQMMGVVITKVKKQSSPINPQNMSNGHREVLQYLNQIDQEESVFDRVGSSEVVRICMLAVRSDFSRQGVGSSLVKATVAMCRKLGAKGITTESASYFAQKIFEREGFETMTELYHGSFVTSSGKTILDTARIHTSTKIYLLTLT